MLTSLVYLQQEKYQKIQKIDELTNMDEEDLDIFRTTSGISMKFSRKMCLMIILKHIKFGGKSTHFYTP